jgi:hypothetical protein
VNWAGHAALGGPFATVRGTWTVPAVGPSSPVAGDATWVGLGGVRRPELPPVGTQAIVLGPGPARYSAWLETVPQPAQPLGLTVQPGNVVTASISTQGRERWSVVFTDDTTRQTDQRLVTDRSTASSAEWSEEAPMAWPLDDFGMVSFRGATAMVNGQGVTVVMACPSA